jgi:hypothetical protein
VSETTYRFESCRGHSLGLAPVAQMDRVPGYGPGGRGFESLRARVRRIPLARERGQIEGA